MSNGNPSIIGASSSNAAIFIYKTDASTGDAWEDVERTHAAVQGIRGELHSDKRDFLSALSSWNDLVDSAESYLCIYSHADEIGIAPNGSDSPRASIIEWHELVAALPRGVRYLWLLGCQTDAALRLIQDVPVAHHLMVTEASRYWQPFLRFFSLEISTDDIYLNDEMRSQLMLKNPDLAKHTTFYDFPSWIPR